MCCMRATPCRWTNLAKQAKLYEARAAFNTIGRGLYDLRQYVLELETACRKESERQMAELL